MENDKKEYKERKPSDKQVFYFNDKGQLVVETNKGVWVDGEKFVKMYGDFVCNAKTMGIIINNFKGVNAQIGDENTYVIKRREFYDMRRSCDILEENSYCIIGLNDGDISDRINEIAEERANELADKKYKNYIVNDRDFRIQKILDYDEAVEKFNALPWWKRIFKKIEVK